MIDRRQSDQQQEYEALTQKLERRAVESSAFRQLLNAEAAAVNPQQTETAKGET